MIRPAETLMSQAIDNSIVDKLATEGFVERPSPRLLAEDVVDDAVVREIEKEGFMNRVYR